MHFGNIEIVWPGWFWAIPSLCLVVALPSVLLFVVIKYIRIPALQKALLAPVCLLGPLFATSLWPFVVSLTGLVQISDSTGRRSADWRTTADLFGDYSVYLWTAVTCVVVYTFYARSRARHQRLDGLLKEIGESCRSDDATIHRSARSLEGSLSESDTRPQGYRQTSSPLPEWLEEKATDAPTMVRVLVEIVDLKLRRESPRIRSCADWYRFREMGTIAGCVALALRLHVYVPEEYPHRLSWQCGDL